MARPGRKSSLGADPRGDTGAPAVATMNRMTPVSSAPTSPTVTPTKASATSAKAPSKRRKARSLFRRWKDVSYRHTWLNPLILVLLVLGGYGINPTPSNPLHHAIFLSYPLPKKTDDPSEPTFYGKGKLDFVFVAFYIVVLSFTREFFMQRVIRPWGVYCGIRSRAKLSRFMEQVYTAMYFAVLGPWGLYVMSRTPLWYFNTDAMFEAFPHRIHEGVFKAYYLVQASYWAQQAIVLCLLLEKPRKDFKELVGHHIITIALIWLSYRFHFTYMGLAVYITHDISDFFLATSKTLNYLDSIVVGPYFTVFIGIWTYLRHYLNLRILWATLTSFRTVGPFELNWETQQYKCWISQYITFSLLAALQAINLFWLYFILKIALNYVSKGVKKDERSDDEDDDESEEEQKRIEKDDAVGPRKGSSGVKGLNGNAKGMPELLVNGHMVEGDTVAHGKENGTTKGKKEGKKKR